MILEGCLPKHDVRNYKNDVFWVSPGIKEKKRISRRTFMKFHSMPFMLRISRQTRRKLNVS